MTQLVRYEAMRHALQEARRVDEVKDISDRAAALQAYARQRHDRELELWVAEIKLRAVRRIGELSAALETAPHGPGRGKSLPADGKPFKASVLKYAGISTSTAHRAEQVASIPMVEFERHLTERMAAKKTVVIDDLLKLVPKRNRRAAIADVAPMRQWCQVDDLERFAETGPKCGTVYADPAWIYGNQSTRGATEDHYVGMTVDEICALPVARIAAKDAHLHLWTTNAFLFDAKRVIEAWGFEYRSCYVWVKPQIGMGNYWRVSHEFMLLGIRGSATFADKSLRSWGEFPRRKHSAKPEEIRALIERSGVGPRIELFARRKAPGWYAWGNQIERSVFDAAMEAA